MGLFDLKLLQVAGGKNCAIFHPTTFFFSDFVQLLQDLNIALAYMSWVQWVRKILLTLMMLYIFPSFFFDHFGALWTFLCVIGAFMVSGILTSWLESRRRTAVKEKIDEVVRDFNSRSKLNEKSDCSKIKFLPAAQRHGQVVLK